MTDKFVELAARILVELSGRKGIGDELDAIDTDILAEIRKEIAEAVRSEVEPLLTHRLVPIAECGELKEGLYYCLFDAGDRYWLRLPTSHPELQRITHILSPWMGPRP